MAARTGPGAVRLAALAKPTRPAPVRSAAIWLLLPLAGLAWGPAVAVLSVAAALSIRWAAATRQRAGQIARERARALDALSLLGADLRAGRAPADALAAAASVACGASGRALAAAASTARLGGDVAGALEVHGSGVPTVLAGLGACWQLCHEVGSGLAAAVERLEEGLRAAEAQRRAITAELAGPRATAQLLAVLPVAGIGLAAALGTHPLQFLLHTPLGLGCLVVGLLLDVGGVLWTRRLIAGALP
jgi:tight adherence protein B